MELVHSQRAKKGKQQYVANELDAYDVKILQLLQDNGLLTNQELSEIVGLSASQCSCSLSSG